MAGTLTDLSDADLLEVAKQTPAPASSGPRPLTELSDDELQAAANFDTHLGADEPKFQTWKQQHAPNDSGADYDLRGAFKAGVTPGANGHWPDTFKKPNHPTFSNESMYADAAPERAGRWEGDKFIPAGTPEVPGLDKFHDEQLVALAVHHGMMQEDEAAKAIAAKKQAERAPIADAAAAAIGIGGTIPEPVAKLLLTKGGRVGDIAAQTVTPIVGGLVGALAGGPAGAAGGGGAGGVTGDTLAQTREYLRGERDDFSKGRAVASTILGAAPLPKLALPGGAPLLSQLIRAGGKRAVQAAGIAVGAEGTGQLIDTGRVNFKSLAQTGLIASVIGAGVGTAEVGAQRLMALRAIRQTPEFKDFDGTNAELIDAVRQKMAKETPTKETINVTPKENKGIPGAPDSEVPPQPAQPAPIEPVPGAVPEVVPESVAPVETPPAERMPGAVPEAVPGAVAPVEAAPPIQTPAEPAKPLAELSNEELQAAAEQAVPAAEEIQAGAAEPAYKQLPASKGGRYVSVDTARQMVPGYDPLNPGPANEPAGAIADAAFNSGLKDPEVKGVTILAGGAGSGKSAAMRQAAEADQLIYDGTFGSAQSPARLDRAVQSGKPVTVVFTYRGLEDAIGGTLTRRGSENPVVPANVAVSGHYKAADNFLAAAKKYADNPNVHFRLFDNSGKPGEAKQVTDPVAFLERVVKERPAYEIAHEQARKHPHVSQLNEQERRIFHGDGGPAVGPAEQGVSQKPERVSDRGSAAGAEAVDRPATSPAPAKVVARNARPLPFKTRITVSEMGGKRSVQIDVPGAKGERPVFSGSPEDAAAAGYEVPPVDQLGAGRHEMGPLPKAPPKAKATRTAAGPQIAPTKAEDLRVSKLADKAALKVQKAFLETALRNASKEAMSRTELLTEAQEKALTKARQSTYRNAAAAELGELNAKAGFLRIEVPGDGKYNVPNYKEALLGLADEVKKSFGKGLDAPASQNALERGNSMLRAYKVKQKAAGKLDVAEREPAADSAPNSAAGEATAASPVRAGQQPPPVERTPPADDPTFSQLPMQLPEMVQFFKMISGGKVPRVVERIRALGGTALGVFRAKVGDVDSGRIELRADLFNVVSVGDKHRLLSDAIAWATSMKQANPEMNLRDAIHERFAQLVKEAEEKALREDPRRATDTLAHEIGHYVDFIPNGTLSRGNILGRIATLNNYLKGFIKEYPGAWGEPPSQDERAKLRRQAEKELFADVKEIVEEITREVPVFKEIPITAEHITSILKTAQRDEFPELYDWFAGLDRATKAAVLRAAMKGIVDERAARYAKREQTGTRTVTETVKRMSGPEPTPEQIRARYGELLRDELKKRGLISERVVRAELMEAMKWWQGVEKVPKYFHTSREMWAEAYTMFLNNPAGLAKRAPTFYAALRTYMLRKPEVRDAYQKLQDDIASGAIHQQRVENLREAWRTDEDAGLSREVAGSKMNWRKVRDTFRLLFTNQQAPIEGRALRKLDTPEGQQVLEGMKNYLYRAAAHEAMARAINERVETPLAEANLHHNDLAEYMFHQRIVNGDRQGLANPQGWSPNTSRERLEEMQRSLGPIAYGSLEEAQNALREIYENQVVNLLEKADVLDPELLQLIKDRTLYAPFAKDRKFNPHELTTIQGLVEQRYGKDVGARIYHQIGTLADIRSPYVALVQKALALSDLAYTQMARKSIRGFLQEHEPHLIMEAEKRFTGTRWEPRIVDNGKVGTLLIMDQGKVTGYYVPREIFETMERGSPLESLIVGLAHKVLAPAKAVLTDLNPGFWAVNFLKDNVTLALQLPRGLAALGQVPRAYMASRATYTGATNAAADRALQGLYLISRSDSRGEHLGNPDEMTRMLLRMGQDPRLFDAEAKKISAAHRAFMWYKQQGQILERTAKIAGMMHLEGEAFATMPEWMKQRAVRELAGSPDFLTRGRAISVVEVFGGPIFLNAWLQGVKSATRAAKQNPKEFWTKFLAFFALPALALWAFEQGDTDLGMDKEAAEDHRDMLRSIPERDKLRGLVIPMGWVDKKQGKVAYLVLPFPDQARFLHAGLRKMLQTSSNDNAKGQGLGSVLQFGGQDLPGQNPVIANARAWWQYQVLGENPYDSFRGGPMLSDDTMKAGAGAAELAKRTASDVTGGILYKFRNEAQGNVPSDLEKFLRLPVIANVVGRWVRVSNAGLTEETDRTLGPVVQHEAQMRLVGQEMTRKSVNGIPWTAAENTLSQNDPYLAQYVVEHQVRVMKGATDQELKAWERASSADQKAALLQAWEARDKARAERLREAK